jgi:AraC-like DNA-binding protein
VQANPNARPHTTSKIGVAKARQSLEDQFLADPTTVPCVRTLARDLGVPYHSLVRGFSNYYAIAPYELVSSMRAQHALLELRRGPSGECSTFTDIAHKWGYADSAHLTRSLRQHFGATPGTLARQLNANWKYLPRRGQREMEAQTEVGTRSSQQITE